MGINPELLKIAREMVQRKEAFVDPAMASGAAPPADPAAAGGAPMDPSMAGGAPMDPAMMGGAPMDPSMMGGAPPPPPAPAGGDPTTMLPLITQAVQAAMSGQGGTPGPNGQIKPKIDVNVALMQLSKMVARIADALKINIPAAEMIATPQDLSGMAQQQAAPAGGDASQQGAIQPLQPLQPAFPSSGGGGGGEKSGSAFDGRGLITMSNRASGLAEVLRRRVS